jgi:hypothetical protein
LDPIDASEVRIQDHPPPADRANEKRDIKPGDDFGLAAHKSKGLGLRLMMHERIAVKDITDRDIPQDFVPGLPMLPPARL